MSAIRIGICTLVAFSVFAHGAVEPWSGAVLEIGAALLLAMWGVPVFQARRLEFYWNPLGWLLLGFGCFALLQYLARLSFYPYLTRIELLRLAAYFLLFFLAVQSFRTLNQWQGFVWFLLVLGFVVSLFGIIQHFTFNGKLYWFRELRYGGIPFGPYVSRNHFAGLMELVVPSGLGIIVLRGVRRDQLPLVILFTIVPIGALFLSASRGGIVSFFFQLGVLAFLIWLKSGERKYSVAGTVAFLLLAGAVVAWLGVGRALERFAKFEQLEVSEARRMGMIKDSWQIFVDHPLVGTGLGTFVAVYPRYETFYDGKVVHHAHNDYVEALAETGVIGALFCLSFVVLLFWAGVSRLRSSRDAVDSALRAGSLVACAGLLAHGVADFNLHIPSNALLFFLQAALSTSEICWRRVTG